jgi:hypothetical protein
MGTLTRHVCQDTIQGAATAALFLMRTALVRAPRRKQEHLAKKHKPPSFGFTKRGDLFLYIVKK